MAEVGLASQLDSGSRSDMDAGTPRASATAITPFYYQLTVAGVAEFNMNRLRETGLEAERAILARPAVLTPAELLGAAA